MSFAADDQLITFTPETFEPFVGETFRVSTNCELVLFEVTQFPRFRQIEGDNSDRQRVPFSLLFRSQASHAPMHGIQCVTHCTLGELHIAINPVQVPRRPGPGATHVFYEAVFA